MRLRKSQRFKNFLCLLKAEIFARVRLSNVKLSGKESPKCISLKIKKLAMHINTELASEGNNHLIDDLLVGFRWDEILESQLYSTMLSKKLVSDIPKMSLRHAVQPPRDRALEVLYPVAQAFVGLFSMRKTSNIYDLYDRSFSRAPRSPCREERMMMQEDTDQSFQSQSSNALSPNRTGMESSFETPPRPACLENLDVERLKSQLIRATQELYERGLAHAAKWAGELVCDMDLDENDDSKLGPGKGKIKPDSPTTSASAKAMSDLTSPISESERNAVALARIYFDLRGGGEGEGERRKSTHERMRIIVSLPMIYDNYNQRQYKRAARTLEDYSGSKALFLRCYSTYMAGERDRLAEMQQKTEPLARAKVQNRELIKLKEMFETRYKAAATSSSPAEGMEREGKYSDSGEETNLGLDPFCKYLYGLVLKQLDDNKMAAKVLVESVNEYPFNWSAWKLLTSLMKSKDTVMQLQLKDHCIKQMFLADVYLELQHHETTEVLDILDALIEVFPNSTHLAAQMAMAHYNMRDFDEAQRLFQLLQRQDPCRLEAMDVYSNILFVKECKAELSFLAHNAIKIDKYRPETCCIIGNYYSLKGEHERAVIYFKRALRLDPNYLSAWTLMGHEYVEMRNSAAAIESYRRAVDINPRDYRAWYGLGQTYEIMRMHNYALYYFQKATKLRPYDPRMWCAMGETFERLGRFDDAIKCYKQAEGNEDPEGTAILRLAKAYQKKEDNHTAAIYYEKVLKRRALEGNGEERRDNADALLFLAKHAKRQGDVEHCEKYCNRLLDIGGTVKDEAKSILMEMRMIARTMKDHGQSKNT
eukprot:jgi/Bigna1/90153/estExt_fgenesh1_pg.C_630098